MATIADNLKAVKARIGRAAQAARRDPAEVTLLAVSKTHPPARVREAAEAGQRAFGENYVQEALAKIDAVSGAQWHLIGPLQSNKTRLVAERFDWVQTLASEKVARRLSEQRPASMAPLNVLVQVNISGEESKAGVPSQELAALARTIDGLKNLKLRGLMAIPEPGAPAERFRAVRELYDRLKAEFGLDTLSMGMSDDLELAIAEGATMVRVGTAIFGQRQKVKSAA
jgi:pyridoxal phosphate enzyme (YggS family)